MTAPYWYRLEGRLNEMQERRRRLIKYLYKKDGKLHEFEDGYTQSIQKKSSIIKKFSSSQLEDLLRTSTKNVAQEVVSSIIPQAGGAGILVEIDQLLNRGSESSGAARRKGGGNGSVKRSKDGDDEKDYEQMEDKNMAQQRQSKSANAARSLTRRTKEQNDLSSSMTARQQMMLHGNKGNKDNNY